jgi:hypothetical protein
VDNVLSLSQGRAGRRVRKDENDRNPGEQLVLACLVGGPIRIRVGGLNLQRDYLVLRQPHEKVELEPSDADFLVELEVCPNKQLSNVGLEVLPSRTHGLPPEM